MLSFFHTIFRLDLKFFEKNSFENFNFCCLFCYFKFIGVENSIEQSNGVLSTLRGCFGVENGVSKIFRKLTKIDLIYRKQKKIFKFHEFFKF